MVGGLITHLAKSIYEPFDESKLELVPGTTTGEPLTMNIQNLSRMHYLKSIDRNSWWWKVGNVQLVRLPELGPMKRVRPVEPCPYSPNSNIDPFLFLVQQPADRAETPPIGGPDEIEGHAAPRVGLNTIDPLGDYSRYLHYPFQQGPYRPDGYDPLRFPPTFATYPPFEEPRVWNQNSRDSMLFGLCNQMHQANLDRSIADHNIYAYHAEQGHFPEGSVHPAFYVPPVEQYSYSEAQGTDRSGNNTDRWSQQPVSSGNVESSIADSEDSDEDTGAKSDDSPTF